MKKHHFSLHAILLIACMAVLLSVPALASAETFATHGNGDPNTPVTFFVFSNGSASVTLKQEKGLCYELSYTHFVDGVLGQEDEWGKYHIRITSPMGNVSYDKWDITFHGSTKELSLPLAGTYKITLTPYTAQEMTDSWSNDTFYYWTEYPYWWVDGCSRCSCTDQIYCDVQIRQVNATTGQQLSTRTERLPYGTTTVYAGTAPSGYSLTGRSWASVTVGMNGVASENPVVFTYERNTPVVTPTQAPVYVNPTQRPYSPPSPSTYNGVFQLPGCSYPLYLRNPPQYIRPQCGPGDQYMTFASKADNGSQLYQTAQITHCNAYFCMGDWVYVEFGYTDHVVRFGFFKKSLFTPADSWYSIPTYTLTPEKQGWVTADTTPYNGPGPNCGAYSSCKLNQGTTVYACFECNGWYFCRFYNDHHNQYGTVYLWVPGSNISWY